MKIDLIYAACFKYDVRFTRILVASIRHWYPDIPICLIKDRFYGDFDTAEIEKIWGAAVLKTEFPSFSWGFSKLAPLFLPAGQRFLVLDSDIVFAGPVLELLESHDANFIVPFEEPTPDVIATNYFDLEKLKKLDPSFVFPGFAFNTGQWVGTTGLLTRADFKPVLDWVNKPRVLHPDIFKYGEQGLFNYVLMKKLSRSEITLDRVPFLNVPGCANCPEIALDTLNAQSPHRFVLHWCGLKRPRLRDMPLGEIARKFEDLYYRRVPFGNLRRHFRFVRWRSEEALRRWARRILRRKR